MRAGRFVDLHVNREARFSLGRDTQTGGLYFSTPISGKVLSVEYEAYFEIDAARYMRFETDPEAGAAFAEDCRMHRQDARQIMPETL